MGNCERYSIRLMLHLDNELDDDEQRVLEAHLKSCASCRAAFNRERRFREGLKGARPLYLAPDALRARVASLPVEARAQRESVTPRAWPRSLLAPAAGVGTTARRCATVALAACFVMVAGIWGTSQLLVPAEAASFAGMAVDAHQRHQRGRLPLEVTTDVAAEISRWFTDKVPFTVKLPNYQDVSGQDQRYRLEGARLVGFEGDYAAYVAYQMDQHPISLVITSTSVAAPFGGETISSKGIVFHYETIDGLKVITWSHRDLTYALVSDLQERGQQSCMVCHQGTKDGDFIEGLSFLEGALVSDAGIR